MYNTVCMRKIFTIMAVLGGLAGLPAARAAAPELLVLTHPGNVSVTVNSGNIVVDLAPVFGFNGTTGTVVQMSTSMGNIYLEMYDQVTPHTVANFLRYIQDGAYTNGLIHRSDPGSVTPGSNTGFVIQGGAILINNGNLVSVVTHDAIANEYNLPNVRGTIAMAKQGGNVDSATSQWFINTGNNSTTLDQANNGGFTVFGHVLGDGMDVVDAIAALPKFNFGAPIDQLPLIDYTQEDYDSNTSLKISNLVLFSAGQVPYLGVSINPPGKVDLSASGAKLFIKPKANATGLVTITLVGTDGSGLEAGRKTTSFVMSIGVPKITTQPKAKVTVKKNANLTLTVVASGAATLKYQWLKNGKVLKNAKGITGATTKKLTLTQMQKAAAGKYTVQVSNTLGKATSSAAVVTVK